MESFLEGGEGKGISDACEGMNECNETAQARGWWGEKTWE